MNNQVLSNSATLDNKEQESLASTVSVPSQAEIVQKGQGVNKGMPLQGIKGKRPERKRPQKTVKFVATSSEQAAEDSLNKFLSDVKRHGFTHKSEQGKEQSLAVQANTQSDVITNDRINSSKLEQLIGSWYYDLAHGGFAIDSTMASLLGIKNFNGYLDQDFIFQYFDEVKRGHIQHYMDSPLLGDLVFRNVTLIKGENAGKRFTFQGQILSRNSLGQTVKAMGSFAYESSPYAEFLTREIANDGLFIWDRKLQRVMSNIAYHQQLEYTEDDFPNTLPDLMGLLHPDDNDILSLQGHILSYPQYGDSYECCTRLRKSDKSYIWTTVRTLVTERNSEGEATKMIGAVTNIDLLQENFDNLKMLMFTDPLTGLHNRTYFHQNQLRYEDPKLFPVSVIFLDVSALKLTNDILGHNYGDFLLLKASQLLQNALQVTLTEFNADEELVQSLIADRRALTNQTSQLGAFFRKEEDEHNDDDANKDDRLTKAKLESQREEEQDSSTLHLDAKPSQETSSSLDLNLNYSIGFDNGFTSGTTDNTLQASLKQEASGNYIVYGYKEGPEENKAEHTEAKSKKDNHIALDCLDLPEGCLLLDKDLSASDRAILELPDNFFHELENKGVTTISMSSTSTQAGKALEQEQEKEQAVEVQQVSQDSKVLEQEAHKTSILDIVSQVTGEQLHEQAEHLSAQEQHDKSMYLQSGQGLGFLGDDEYVKPRKLKPTLENLKSEVSAEILSKRDTKYPPEILRMGGDEFIVLCPQCDERKIRRLYENIFKIRDALLANQIACPIEQRAVPLCFGIGYATVGEKGTHNDDFLQALQRADYRMQTNKEKYHDKHYELLQAYFEEKLNRRVSMRDDRRMKILSQKERNKLRQHLQE